METEIYEHYATGERKELEIIEEFTTHKIGHEKETDKYFKIIKDKHHRWQINKTSFFMLPKEQESEAILCEFCKTKKQIKTLDGKSWATKHEILCPRMMNTTSTST